MSFVTAKIQQNCTDTGNDNSEATRQRINCDDGTFCLRIHRYRSRALDIFKKKRRKFDIKVRKEKQISEEFRNLSFSLLRLLYKKLRLNVINFYRRLLKHG